MAELPVWLLVADVAALLGWSTTRTRAWLKRAGACIKRNGRWIVPTDRLRELWPEVADRLRQSAEN
jgi:phage antirepressor YoqD-like protein